MTESLKPCPFCGWKAILVGADKDHVNCTNYDGCLMTEGRYPTVEAWNTRHPTGLVPLDEIGAILSFMMAKGYHVIKYSDEEEIGNDVTTQFTKDLRERFGQPRVVLPKRKECGFCTMPNLRCECEPFNQAIDALKTLNPQINFGEE